MKTQILRIPQQYRQDLIIVLYDITKDKAWWQLVGQAELKIQWELN